ncbi:MAG TPA: response regulator [Candidatus Nitrosotenuis sp.]|nr:response regulator [Candidatus Nitrosotenuis sp.]
MALDILIAEDNEFTAKQYKIALEKRKHKVTLAKDGVECVDFYTNEAKYEELFRKTRTPPFDLVLLDHDMPRKTGADAAKEILECRPNQRLIFLSAYGNNIMQRLKDLRDETVQIIQKPFALNFLIKKIEGSNIKNRIVNLQDDNLATSSQDGAAIR